MSRSLGQIIGDGLQLSLNYSRGLLEGVSADSFARMAAPGGQVIQSNHPAFIYGHLSLYGPRIIGFAGGSAPETPEGFAELFTKGAECQDDVDGTIYPAMNVITDFYFQGFEAALEAIRQADDERLQQPNPGPSPMAEKFPTTGSMCNFLGAGHMMIHLGQMSAWRRMQGMAPA